MTQTVLITGANRGIGQGLTQHYLAQGWQVHACARDITALPGHDKLIAHALDVIDHAAIDALAGSLPKGSLDLIINNAGVYGGDQQGLDNLDFDAWARTMAINTFAPVKLASAFAARLKDGGKLANISSLMGSVADASRNMYAYRTSKTALNMAVKLMAADFAPRKIAVVALHPGWVQTDMGGEQAPVTVSQSVAGLTKVIAELTLAQSGGFIDYTGKVLPW